MPCVFQGNPEASGVELRIQFTPIVQKLMKNLWPSEITVEEVSLINKMPLGNPPYAVDVTKALSAWQIQASFVLFYESILASIQKNHSNDSTKWPAVFNFARVVRNACAHNGRIYFANTNAPLVAWKNISYSYADNGKQIIFHDLATADIIVLMNEMDSQL